MTNFCTSNFCNS